MSDRRYRIDESLKVLLDYDEQCDLNDPEQAAFHEIVQAVGEADLRRDRPGYNPGTALELCLARIAPALLSWLESIEERK